MDQRMYSMLSSLRRPGGWSADGNRDGGGAALTLPPERRAEADLVRRRHEWRRPTRPLFPAAGEPAAAEAGPPVTGLLLDEFLALLTPRERAYWQTCLLSGGVASAAPSTARERKLKQRIRQKWQHF